MSKIMGTKLDFFLLTQNISCTVNFKRNKTFEHIIHLFNEYGLLN